MCIGVVSLEHPDYALILCSNRDEYLSRPTENARFHSPKRPFTDQPTVLSGRDLQGGGTWLGINLAGRVGLLTNITEIAPRFRTTRGHLVSSFLFPGDSPVLEYIQALTENHSTVYAGFNVLLLSPEWNTSGTHSYSAWILTNSGAGGSIIARQLTPEERKVYCVSNGIEGLDGQQWPKVQQGRTLLNETLFDSSPALSEEDLVERLFEVLSWTSEEPITNRWQLRNSIQIPPLRFSASLDPDAANVDAAPATAPADRPDLYGTRVSTVILVRHDGNVLYVERDIWELDGSGTKGRQVIRRNSQESSRAFRFQIEPQ